MPRDSRLYMTFPIDFHRHPKLSRLAPEVRWTFVEMNGEARIADNDGVFAEGDAEFMWPVEHLDALVASHPTKPLVIHVDGTYVIREYAEHQETRAAREERSRRNTENGRKGGRPKGSGTVSPVKVSEMTARLAGQRGLQLPGIVSAIAQRCGIDVTADQAWQTSLWILEKAKTAPKAPQRYVLSVIDKSTAEVQQWLYTQGIAG